MGRYDYSVTSGKRDAFFLVDERKGKGQRAKGQKLTVDKKAIDNVLPLFRDGRWKPATDEREKQCANQGNPLIRLIVVQTNEVRRT